MEAAMQDLSEFESDLWEAADSLRANSKLTSSDYFMPVLGVKHMHFISTDVAVPGLNRDLAYSRPLLVPPKNVLRAFLEIASPIHDQSDKVDEVNQKLRAARNLLLPRLMSEESAV